ncbi:MAG: ABC transporter ATP-binding protein [Chloroflexota bacterium]|nr:ABC transporter ATP-binding protein [Chloroflexota bacterium]
MEDVLRIEDLRVSYRDRDRTVRAVGGVDLALGRGRTLCIVGESGCGKTTVALSILNLLPGAGRIDSGRILFEGRDVLALRGDELRGVRGREISMIFQDPVSGLNPVMAVGPQVAEIVQTHLHVSKPESRQMVLDALRRQGLSDAERVAGSYPFQLSGGMCQRVMIAISTVLKPSVIIADEPTSALDVTVQAGILQELNELKAELGASIILITHDLGVVAKMADDVAVMYAGRVVEQGEAADVYARPRHPYTAALLAARPRLDEPGRRLRNIPGAPPDMAELAGTCAFLSRCTKAISICRSDPWPPLIELGAGHAAACYNPVFQPEVTTA